MVIWKDLYNYKPNYNGIILQDSYFALSKYALMLQKYPDTLAKEVYKLLQLFPKTELTFYLMFSTEDIHEYVLGKHSPTSFVNWTSLNINVPNTEKNEINNKVRRISLNIVDELGFTAYGVSTALLKITKSIEEGKREVLPVSTYLEDYDIFISTPSIIGKDGVYENNKGTFDETEKMEFEKSVNKINQNMKKIQLIE